MKQKPRISKTESVRQILILLRKGYATTEILKVIQSNSELPEGTFYDHYREAYPIYQEELQGQQKEIERVGLAEAKKAAQKGLKSKFERDIAIQKRIEYYESILDGSIKVSFILGQKVSQTENLPINVVLLIQSTVNELWKELGKRLGDYPATKTDITTNGKEITLKYSEWSIEQIKSEIERLREK